jgi:hypothetical protein
VPAFFNGLASYGLPGLVILILAWWIVRQDTDLKSERAARIADAKDYNTMALGLQSQVLTAVNKLSDVFEEVKKLIPIQPRER